MTQEEIMGIIDQYPEGILQSDLKEMLRKKGIDCDSGQIVALGKKEIITRIPIHRSVPRRPGKFTYLLIPTGKKEERIKISLNGG